MDDDDDGGGEPDGTGKRKRTTVRDGLKNECVVQSKLGSVLKERQLIPHIKAMVEVVSKIAHRGSLLFGHLVLHALETDQLDDLDFCSDTLYLNCFLWGIKKQKDKELKPVMRESMEACADFAAATAVDRLENDTQAIAASAGRSSSSSTRTASSP